MLPLVPVILSPSDQFRRRAAPWKTVITTLPEALPLSPLKVRCYCITLSTLFMSTGAACPRSSGSTSGPGAVSAWKSVEMPDQEKIYIFVMGRRWTDSAGNTYHRVTVFGPHGVTVSSEVTYRYEDQYIQTACKMIRDLKLIPGLPDDPFLSIRKYCEHTGGKFVAMAANVRRRSDL